MLRVTVNRDLCVGAGLCVARAGAVFDQSEEDGLVVLQTETPAEDMRARVSEAADRCPSQAIKII